MRPFGGLWSTSGFVQSEKWLGRPIGWVPVMLARKEGAGTMAATAAGLMRQGGRNAIPPSISTRIELVVAVPLAFGRTAAKTPAGIAEIGRMLDGTAAGAWDAQYRQVAASLVDGGHGGAVVRLGHEQTGSWYPWSAVGNPVRYVAAFRHVRQVMAAVAPGLRFEFNSATAGFAEWGAAAYPGDDAVDIVGLDIYNKTVGRNPAPFASVWARKLLPALTAHLALARAHGKPVSYAEWANGSRDDPGFVTNMAAWFAALPAAGPGSLVHQAYFDAGKSGHRLANSPLTAAAYRKAFGR